MLRSRNRLAVHARRMARSLHASPLAAASGKRGPVDPSEGFLSGNGAIYMDSMYRTWRRDPQAVHASWDAYFRNVDNGAPPGQAFVAPPTLGGGGSPSASFQSVATKAANTSPHLGDQVRLTHLIRAFQVKGHMEAAVDPLERTSHIMAPRAEPDLDFANYGFSEAELDTPVQMEGYDGIKGFLGRTEQVTLRELLDRLRATYCGSIGYEYMHIQNSERCNWLRERIELVEPPKLSKEKKMQIYDRLNFSATLESFLEGKYNTAKRFGLEGAEALVPGLKALIDRATELGVSDMVLGMPHRGRLNTLVNVVRKPAELLFKEFQGLNVDLEDYVANEDEGRWQGQGDVKYHLGTSYDRKYPDGREIHLSLVANPSHLEAVNPVVMGKVRAKQDKKGEENAAQAMGVLMHGDAAFAGQGVVYESMQLAKLQAFGTKGTVHLVVNNQIGFTTDSHDSRSTRYCTDLGKAFDVPVFHVNADDPEAVVRVFELAAEYRQEFGEDVIIDLIGYRKYGHNEIDQPSFTQPLMYKNIDSHKPSLAIYRQQLIDEGTATAEELDANEKYVTQTFEDRYEQSKTYESTGNNWLSSHWGDFFSPNQYSAPKATGVELGRLQEIGAKLTDLPEGFTVHRGLKRILQAKADAISAGDGLDWATAEALAFGSLAREGNLVRMTGQDVERGTFSHRHAVLHDQKTDERFTPLQHLSADQAPVMLFNSCLSEYAVMGFELGYSLEQPHQLNIWEAQFGDFANGAQIMFDQFLSAGETKWHRQCGLTVLLPHGYDGQGPEHSSCRLERFLQQSDDPEDVFPSMDRDSRHQIQHTNWQVVNCTTPANYFHVLRRQIHRNFRKPLIVAAPKQLLRLPAAKSSLADMADGTRFERYIPDTGEGLVADEGVKRLVLCSGKVYYDLVKQRDAAGLDDVAIGRVEQLTPFPFDHVRDELNRFPNAEVVWAQEEPRNMGAWTYVSPRIATAARHSDRGQVTTAYAGRDAAAAPATGSAKVHDMEQKELVHAALGLPAPPQDA